MDNTLDELMAFVMGELETLKQKCRDYQGKPLAYQGPSAHEQKVYDIVEKVGPLLLEKKWAGRNNEEAVVASFKIAEAFRQTLNDSNDFDELSFLVLSVGQSLTIKTMPSATSIQDWIKGFGCFSLDEMILIGKSAACTLAKQEASNELVHYVKAAAYHGDAFSDTKIRELLKKDKTA